MLTLVLFILILSSLILVHELGHYFAAKRCGVRVEEFGLGLPPRLYGKKIGETVYSINAFPFGGFVRLTGEDPASVTKKSLKDPRSFSAKSAASRVQMLGAGIFMNLLLAVISFYVLFFLNNFKTLDIPILFDFKFPFGRQESINTVISMIQEGSTAYEAGVNVGEAVLEVDGIPVTRAEDVRALVEDKVGQEVTVLLMNVADPQKSFRTVKLIPQPDEEGFGRLGIYLSTVSTVHYDSVLENLFAGFLHSYNMTLYSGVTLGRLVGMSVAQRDIAPVSDSVSGPVGIYSIVQSILLYSKGQIFLNLLNLFAFMSLTLGIMNLLPFPALDGSRLAFVLIEKVKGKRVNPIYEANLHKWGMLLLLGLLVLVTIKDFARIFE